MRNKNDDFDDDFEDDFDDERESDDDIIEGSLNMMFDRDDDDFDPDSMSYESVFGDD